MAHNLDMTNGRANVAFLGSRNDVWHRLGQEMKPGMTIEQWAKEAGLDWHAVKAPVYAQVNDRQVLADGWRAIVRSDTLHTLGIASDRYQPVQPADVLAWFGEYISADPRFQLDVAGSLKNGEIIWATATFNGDMSVAGDNHKARLLMTTTFDGTGATINQGTMERAVCNNMLNVALSDKRAVVRTRHNTRFDAKRVGAELATIAQGFEAYKAMGDAMGEQKMTKDVIAKYFKRLLDIPFDAKRDDISTRKMNQFQDLNSAYRSTLAEGTQPETAWTALNAVTRYVDHDRSTRGGNGGDESRFLSAQFGSGAAMKAHAVELLTVDAEFKELLAQPFVASAGNVDHDVAAILSRPFRG